MPDEKCADCTGPHKEFCDGDGNVAHVVVDAAGVVRAGSPLTIRCPEKDNIEYPQNLVRTVGGRDTPNIVIATQTVRFVENAGLMLVRTPVNQQPAGAAPPPPEEEPQPEEDA